MAETEWSKGGSVKIKYKNLLNIKIMEGVQRNQIAKELLCCDWDFDFYSNCSGEPL